MSAVTRTSSSIESRLPASSDAPADALAHRGAPSDSASSLRSSPRSVIRGESPPISATKVIDISGESGVEDDFYADSEVLQVRTSRSRKSVRINLSVPRGMDDVLLGLADLTGSSKSSFVMEALHAYLPALKRRLAEHNQLHHPRPRRRHAAPAAEAPPEPQDFLHLSRQQRRKLEREQKKALGRGGGRE